MNAYFILHSEVIYWPYNDYDPPEPYSPCDIVIAENRSKAKYLFWQKYEGDVGPLNEMKLDKTRKICEELRGPARILDSSKEHDLDSALWTLTGYVLEAKN